MDWQIAQAAAIAKTKSVRYSAGKGAGLLFQDYAGCPSDFGYFVSSPYSDGLKIDVNAQTVLGGDVPRGGYDAERSGAAPWSTSPSLEYLVTKDEPPVSVTPTPTAPSSATSMTTGHKTYNNAINIDPHGNQLIPIAHRLQQQGWAVGAVSSVPISHATPAAAYAHNVHRNDYQDISRDMLGLPSISHPDPLPGMDVVIGGGYGATSDRDADQGKNFEPGHSYLADSDLLKADVRGGGRYITAVRTTGIAGRERLFEAAAQAASGNHRLLGFYGVGTTAAICPTPPPTATIVPSWGRISGPRHTRRKIFTRIPSCMK